MINIFVATKTIKVFDGFNSYEIEVFPNKTPFLS